MKEQIDSRQLLQQLTLRLTLDEPPEEKKAILSWVLEHELHLSKTDILRGNQVKVDKGAIDKIINRLNNHEPVQYILGESWFYGRRFTVNPSVLIPRPETEILVRTVADRFRGKEQPITILDIGTGSGCIAITLALELPGARIIATDISRDALAVAKKNAEQLHARVQFEEHDILTQPLDYGPFDIIVSNPPYVLEEEKSLMKANVTGFEPHTALFVPDDDPLLFHRAIAEKARKSLRPGGFLVMEINEGLGAEVQSLLQTNNYVDIEVVKDLNGKDRFAKGIHTRV